jgi:hypothetical protein
MAAVVARRRGHANLLSLAEWQSLSVPSRNSHAITNNLMRRTSATRPSHTVAISYLWELPHKNIPDLRQSFYTRKDFLGNNRSIDKSPIVERGEPSIINASSPLMGQLQDSICHNLVIRPYRGFRHVSFTKAPIKQVLRPSLYRKFSTSSGIVAKLALTEERLVESPSAVERSKENSLFWQGLPQWKDISAEDFNSYRWQVSDSSAFPYMSAARLTSSS